MSDETEKNKSDSKEVSEEVSPDVMAEDLPAKTSIPIDEYKTNFDTFLGKKNNTRIFFSAPFGMGKTYFLTEFFATRGDDYNVFHLYPVKYQIRGDVEMVEVIGADIFVRLYEGRDSDESKEIVEYLLKEKNFKQKLKYTAGSLLKCFGSMVSVTPDMIDTIRDLLMGDGVQEIQRNLVGIHNNFFEDLVGQILSKLKEKIGKENILILDDLDRFEPRHIFKLLNAFSPVHDHEGNKYGFDRVIFVGDVDNIEKIFHHIYGKDTDFSGYIDKFFSETPYRYDMEREIHSSVSDIFSKYVGEKDNNFRASIDGGNIFHMLIFILMFAVKMRVINLRRLLMPQNISLSALDSHMYGQRERGNEQVNIAVRILLDIFAGKKQLLDFISEKLMPVFENKMSDYGVMDQSDEGEYDIQSL